MINIKPQRWKFTALPTVFRKVQKLIYVTHSLGHKYTDLNTTVSVTFITGVLRHIYYFGLYTNRLSEKYVYL
jgi:hypothetical protein